MKTIKIYEFLSHRLHWHYLTKNQIKKKGKLEILIKIVVKKIVKIVI